MSVTNIADIVPTQLETLNIIEAIESDFSHNERVLIKADWAMQHVVEALQDNNLNTQNRAVLIKQLNAAITSVQNELYQEHKPLCDDEPNAA